MPLNKVHPIEIAVDHIDQTIKTLKMQREALVALLPKKKKKPDDGWYRCPLSGAWKNYLTGEKSEEQPRKEEQ